MLVRLALMVVCVQTLLQSFCALVRTDSLVRDANSISTTAISSHVKRPVRRYVRTNPTDLSAAAFRDLQEKLAILSLTNVIRTPVMTWAHIDAWMVLARILAHVLKAIREPTATKVSTIASRPHVGIMASAPMVSCHTHVHATLDSRAITAKSNQNQSKRSRL